MNSLDDLIAAIEAEYKTNDTDSPAWDSALEYSIDLITTLSATHVLVPKDDFNMAINTAINILNLADSVKSESIEEMAKHIADTLLSSAEVES